MSLENQGVFQLLKEVTFRRILVFYVARKWGRLYKFFRRDTGKFVVFALEDCHITAELALPLEYSLVVREGPA